MSVYVDNLFATAESRVWRYPMACHMTADSLSELHAFAADMKLKRCWFHGGTHYDLTANKRALAVQLGAVQVDARTIVQKTKALRERQPRLRPWTNRTQEKGTTR